MRRGSSVAVLTALALSGCLGGGTGASTPVAATGAMGGPVAAAGDVANNTTLPLLPLPPDPWAGNFTELVLFEGRVQAPQCVTVGTPLNRETVDLGCADGEVPIEGPFIPEGTLRLRLEADATQALKSGGYHAYLYSNVRWTGEDENASLRANGETSTAPVHTWTWDLAPAEWDVPVWSRSSASMGLWPSGTGGANLLDGPIAVKVVAERNPVWAPLASVDAFAAGSGYASPEDGVVTVLDQNLTMVYSSAVNGFLPGANYPDSVPFQQKVPAGTEQVVLGIRWEAVQGCASADECSVRGVLGSGRQRTTIGAALVNEVGRNYRILAYDVDDHVLVDGPYVNGSLTQHYPWLDDCTPAGTRAATSESCASTYYGPPQDLRAEVRYLAEAWREPVDLAAFRARLGVA